MMKYTNEIVKKIVEDYNAGVDVKMIASDLTKEMGQVVPERSVIAKLSSLGVYKRKVYTSKTGSVPIKKEEYIAKISKILKIDIELLESLEKVTKTALMLIVDRLEK